MANLADLNPAFLPLLNAYTGALDKAGIGYRVDSGYRTPEQQAEIYARSNQGRNFAAAPPWRSFHNYGLAADVIPKNPADYARMHDLARQAGLYDAQSGLGFTSYDPPHVEMPGSLPNLISQYHLANWRPQSQPAPGQGAVAYTEPTGRPSRPATTTPGPLMFGGLNPDARGMRNNNPGNLVANDFTAGLPGYKGSDGKFAIFDTPEHGAAALDRNLTSYGTKGINTPLGIASTWAPASDNNDPNSYGARIAKSLGVGPNDKIDLSDPSVRNKVSQAIGLVENGPGQSPGFRTAYTGYGSTLNTTGAPPAVAGGAPAAPATKPAGTTLPGFQPGSEANKMATAGLQKLAGKGPGQEDKPPEPIQPMQLAPPPAMGGSMMLGPGGMNMMPRTQAATYPAMLAAMMGGGPQAAPPPPGAATGMPGLPGTTLNSPSQLQMALMTGQMSPYDLYGGGASFGQGS